MEFGEDVKSMEEKKRSSKIKWIIGLCLLLAGILWVLYSTRIRVGNDRAEFEKQCRNYLVYDIPNELNEFCSVNKEGLFMKYYMYSFVLNEESYNAYKEDVLSKYSVDLSDEEQLSYGYAHWYGMKVSDVNKDNPDYILDEFPFGLPFEKIIEDDINDYSIILYSPTGTGSRQFGILCNDAEHRIVCYYAAQIR